jgi:hypothetical protein
MLSISSGPARVLADGAVTTFGAHPLYFELDLGADAAAAEAPTVLALGIRFLSDAADPNPRVASMGLDDGFRLDLINFDGADGRGSAQPVLIGEVGEDLVFLHFRVFRFGRSEDRTLMYTFYRVSKTEVDWSPVVQPASGG